MVETMEVATKVKRKPKLQKAQDKDEDQGGCNDEKLQPPKKYQN